MALAKLGRLRLLTEDDVADRMTAPEHGRKRLVGELDEVKVGMACSFCRYRDVTTEIRLGF